MPLELGISNADDTYADGVFGRRLPPPCRVKTVQQPGALSSLFEGGLFRQDVVTIDLFLFCFGSSTPRPYPAPCRYDR